MGKLKNRTNIRCGKLVPFERANNDKYGNAQWFCRCDCGNISVVNGCCLEQQDTKSCGCNQSHLRPYESTYNRLLEQNKRYKVELSYEDFLNYTKETECHYCGGEITWNKFGSSSKKYNLDRKNNNLGYTLSNCVVCCERCNIGKGQYFTYNEWLQIGKVIRSWKQ